MTGPRITSGGSSKQDYCTPIEMIAAVEQRFGPIEFDLAAHDGNTRYKRYFAPTEFIYKGSIDVIAPTEEELASGVVKLIGMDKKKAPIYERRMLNRDPNAWGFDAFKHSWAALSQKFQTNGKPGLLWNNCEFSDITPWAAYHAQEAAKGANTLLLVPASVGSNWGRDYVLPRADVYFLNGRISFDGKNPYPKDCMVAHFHADVKLRGPRLFVWEWEKDRIHQQWGTTTAWNGA